MSEMTATIARSTVAQAPGKIILVGEHAVVYRRPAIAAPVWSVVATASIEERPVGYGCRIDASDIQLTLDLATAAPDQPLAVVTRLALERLDLVALPNWQITLRSDLPIAGGLGSGAAVSTALVRAIYAHVGQSITPKAVSELVYASEMFYHGMPSGIDNTVIAYGEPVWFVKGEASVAFSPACTLTIVIADSGIPSPTKETVGDVRQGWLADPKRYEGWFDQIGALANAARRAIEQGQLNELGRLFNDNHALLQGLGVSSPLLDQLVAVARKAGALGAKLSGGGRGGNVIALVDPQVDKSQTEGVKQAFLAAGAKRVLETQI